MYMQEILSHKWLKIKSVDIFITSLTLYQFKVMGLNDFEWVKNLRYYWDPEIDDCVVRMSNSYYIYGYEYLGASPRLVITPLTVSIATDRSHDQSYDYRIVVTCASWGHCNWIWAELLPAQLVLEKLKRRKI